MNKWTIKKRVTFGFATVLTLLTFITISSVILLRKVDSNIQDILKDALPGTTIAGKIKLNVMDGHLATWRFIIAQTPEDKAGQIATIERASKSNEQLLKEYEPTIFTDEDRRIYEKLKQALGDYANARKKMIDMGSAGKPLNEIFDLNKTTFHPAHAALDSCTDALFAENEKSGNESGAASRHSLNQARLITIGASASGLILGIVCAVMITTGLGRILRQLADTLNEGSDQVASASAQVAAASQSLAQGVSEQAASLEETSASLEEISSMTRRNADNARNAKDLSNQTRNAAETGASDMREMSVAMSAIKASSDNIAKIIKTIDEIAFQTNILALNAAVEAARAGEAGMGFAVVADEVRSLAQRSAQAARETAENIEDSIRKSEHGVRISGKVSESLREIVAKARQVDELVAGIATASGEQNQGISQVNTAVTEMDKVTQSSAAGAEESASAAEEMNAQAKSLKDSVAELIALVGGASKRDATEKYSNAGTKEFQSFPSVIQNANENHEWLSQPVLNSNGKGLGRQQASTLLVGSTSQPFSDIPLEGGFEEA